MSENFKRRKAKNSVARFFMFIMCFAIVVAIAAGSVVVIEDFILDGNIDTNGKDTVSNITSSVDNQSNEPQEPKPITKVSTATVVATGDLFIQSPIINNAKLDDGSYNFDDIFQYLSEYTSKADYAVANLETTLNGENNKYGGSPKFNCPDEIVDSLKTAGFDMLLTANSHSYDTNSDGFDRTLGIIGDKGLDALGTVKNVENKNYIVKDINGIKLGMICYTNETNDTDNVTLNGMTLKDDAADRINTFSYGKLEEFYERIEHQLKSMKDDGAEGLVLFIHWGDEYQVKQNKTQEEMAQMLCDLGIDVIIGSHPHVVQPIELLTSKNDSKHKTVCVYSLGNTVSNQRKESMNLKTGHTEDGMLFEFTFAKYSDGTVVLEAADALPFWVNMFDSARKGKRVYQIIPLDTENTDWKESFDLVDSSEKKSQDSLERTEKIIGGGLKEVKDYLNSEENKYPKSEK